MMASTVCGDAAIGEEKTYDFSKLWHFRMAHISIQGIKELICQGILGSGKVTDLDTCETCIYGKSVKMKFPKKALHTTKSPLEYIHSDLWGPSQTPTHGGARYFLSIIDDYSRMVWVFVLKTKDNTFDAFKTWKIMIENQKGERLKVIRTDNGLEFCNKEFTQLCNESGILRHLTAHGNPNQNGLAERMNRTLLERVRCMLFHARLSKAFWGEAVVTAAYLINRSPSSALGYLGA